MKKLITLAALAALPLALAACSNAKTEKADDWSAASSVMSDSAVMSSVSSMADTSSVGMKDDTSAAMEKTNDAASAGTTATDGARD